MLLPGGNGEEQDAGEDGGDGDEAAEDGAGMRAPSASDRR